MEKKKTKEEIKKEKIEALYAKIGRIRIENELMDAKYKKNIQQAQKTYQEILKLEK